jgi:hypothetical protein
MANDERQNKGPAKCNCDVCGFEMHIKKSIRTVNVTVDGVLLSVTLLECYKCHSKFFSYVDTKEIKVAKQQLGVINQRMQFAVRYRQRVQAASLSDQYSKAKDALRNLCDAARNQYKEQIEQILGCQ